MANAKKCDICEAFTAIVNDPLRSEIYQCNNHEDGKWEKLGTIMGYA